MSNNNKQVVFLVDDEPIQNEMLKDYLSERFIFDIKTFENGEDALKNMNLNPTIIVLDYHLSAHNTTAKNGVEILKEIKEKYPAVTVIMLSGQDKLEVAIDSMKYGAYDYVVKGETAFSRTENLMNNIMELFTLKDTNATYKRTVIILSVAVGLIVLLALYLNFFTTAYSH
jgi:DNA-binding NtrC family response regulator